MTSWIYSYNTQINKTKIWWSNIERIARGINLILAFWTRTSNRFRKVNKYYMIIIQNSDLNYHKLMKKGTRFVVNVN